MRNLILLGSTGSIGTQTLKIADKTGCAVYGLCGHSNHELLNRQIKEHRPTYVAVTDERAAKYIEHQAFIKEIFVGENAAAQLAQVDGGDIVLNAVVGAAGLRATLASLEIGRDVALANKESLVAGGKLVMNTAKKTGAKIIPVDSEHSAIFQCLQNEAETKNLRKIHLTASGGPFFGKNKKELEKITVKEALNHPNWSMGNKITIDSATLMNKGLEVIEAAYLFGISADNINVVVHRQSIVHSMVEFCDGAILAQLGVPDMAVPIAYALTYPERAPHIADVPNLMEMNLTFERPDPKTFTCLSAALRALELGGTAACMLNAANEVAVDLFLNQKIGFNDIGRIVNACLDNYDTNSDYNTIDELMSADKASREFAAGYNSM